MIVFQDGPVSPQMFRLKIKDYLLTLSVSKISKWSGRSSQPCLTMDIATQISGIFG